MEDENLLIPREVPDWSEWFMDLAFTVSKRSKDRSTQVGCVVVRDKAVLSIGYNGFPHRFPDDVDKWHQRPAKYLVTVHAELNALLHAARHGVNLSESDMYVTWPLCARCAAAAVQAGIKNVISAPPQKETPKWGEEFVIAKEILRRCSVGMWWYVASKPKPYQMCDADIFDMHGNRISF